MADKTNDMFDGFEAIVDTILPTASFKDGSANDDSIPELDDINDLDADDADDKDLDTDGEGQQDDDTGEGDSNTGDEPTDDADDLSEFEPQIAKFFKEKFADSFGMDFTNAEVEDIESLVSVIKEEIAEASKPVYASEEIEALNKFVMEGGNLADYLSLAKSNTVNIDSLSKDNEADLKAAIAEKLRIQGFKEDRIRRAISRYEDTDLLQDEGEDAIDFLQEYKNKEQAKLLKTQEKMHQQRQEQQQLFIETVEKRIKDLKDIKGFTVTDKQRKELVDYIFKPTSDGSTAYQKQYMSDVQNLIESAFFTKYGEGLAKSAKNAGRSSAYKDLHQSLKATKGKMSSSSQTSQKYKSGTDSIFNLIGK